MDTHKLMLRRIYSLSACLLITSCAWQGNRSADAIPAVGSLEQPVTINTQNCNDILTVQTQMNLQRFDSKRIRLLNWNTHKQSHAGMQDALSLLGREADLILLQEALVDHSKIANIDAQLYWVFAPGYIQSSVSTGVMTASRVAPLAYCKFSNIEPWLGSPKATNITRYGLSGTDETLLVINVHLINFTLGISAMQTQLEQALVFVAQHDGPVIISGDFNTWSKEREEVVASMLGKHGLQSVQYVNDQRTRIFGHPVDHFYVRGIHTAVATSYPTENSDHNPIAVVLELL